MCLVLTKYFSFLFFKKLLTKRKFVIEYMMCSYSYDEESIVSPLFAESRSWCEAVGVGGCPMAPESIVRGEAKGGPQAQR